MCRPIGLGFVSSPAVGRSASLVVRYCGEIDLFLRRRGLDAGEVLVDDGADYLGLDTLIAALDRPGHRVRAVVVPSLDHVGVRLGDLAARVPVWTMYPERCWLPLDSDEVPPLRHSVGSASPREVLLDHLLDAIACGASGPGCSQRCATAAVAGGGERW